MPVRLGGRVGMLEGVRRVGRLIARERDLHVLLEAATRTLAEVCSVHPVCIVLESGERSSSHSAAAPPAALESALRGERVNGPDGTVALPLECDGRIWGAISLTLLSTADDEELSLLSDLAEDLAYAVRNLERDRALGESERRFRSLFEHAAVAIVEVEPVSGRFRRVNQKFCDIVGRTREELLQLSFADVSDPDGLRVDRDNLAQLIAGAAPSLTWSKRYLHRDGSPVWVRLTVSRSEPDPGGGYSFIAVIEDVSERNRIEAALRESRKRLEMVYQASLAGIIVNRFDDGAILDVNDAMVRLLGWSRDEMIGRSTKELEIYSRPEERARVYDELGRTGSLPPLEVSIRRKSGEEGIFLITAGRAVLDGETCVVGVWHDVTALRQADAALRERDREMGATFDVASVGIGQADPTTSRFVRVNARLCSITGYSQDELLQMRVFDVTHPDDRQRETELFHSLIAGAISEYRVEKRCLRKDGSEVWVNSNVSVLRNAAGVPLRTVATVEDISKRREAESTRRLLTSALEAAGNAIAITDAAGVVEWVNGAFARLTGYDEAELIGRELLHEDALPTDRRSKLLDGQSWHGEQINRRKDGSLYHEDETITPVRDEQGRLTHFIAIKQDVSERKRAEGALAEAEERHRLALEAADQGTFVHDLASGTMALDERGMRHFGVERAVVEVGQMLLRCHPDDRPILAAAMEGALSPSGIGRVDLEHRVVLRSGEVRWLAVHGRTVFAEKDGARRPSYVIATSQDVTQARRAGEELRLSEERYRSLVDNLDDVIFSTDLSGTITYVNRAVACFGFRPEDVIGRPRDELVHAEDRDAVRGTRAQLAMRRPLECRIMDADGKARFVRGSSQPLIYEGKVVGFTGFLVDLTLQRETEEQLRAAQKLEAVGRLAGGVAHDFNNLLSVILSYAELAVDDLRVEDPLRADLEEVVMAAKRAETLTRQLLAFSRRQVLQPEAIDLDVLVAGVGNMLRRLIGEDVELEVIPAGEPCRTRADRGQIEQVLMNLVVNARDALPDGGRATVASANVEIDAGRAATLEVEPGHYVELAVSDNGCGMDPATRARIFEPFFTTKEVGKGTGLGLSMVYGIVKQSGGGISVESTVGEGTTFHIYLPRLDASDLPTPVVELPPADVRGHETVLVVEDEAALRHVVCRVLASAGYHVLVAANGGEALLICEKRGSEIELIVTDVVMPGMNGKELAVRLAPLCPSAKVLFTSGYTADAIARHGVFGKQFLPKPYDMQTLTRTVRTVLDG